MTLIGNNPLLKGASGMLGNTVYYRKWRGRLIMCNKPKRRKSLSNEQKKTVSRFKLASKYAVGQMKDEDAKAAYQQGTNNRYHSAYLVALNDYLNAPRVAEIQVHNYSGSIGDKITIDAWDDFKVVRVNVVITDIDGAIIEEGDAMQSKSSPHLWKYKATVTNSKVKGSKIVAMAFDKPRNMGIGEVLCD